MGIGTGRVDDDEIVGLLDHGQDVDETGKFDGFVVVELLGRAARHAMMLGQGKGDPRPLGPGTPVIDVTGEALLPQVEVDRGDALPEIQQRDRDVHGESGLSRAPFLIAEHNDMRRGRPPATRLHQHDLPSFNSSPSLLLVQNQAGMCG